jgi:uncharacterized protein (DUF1499 family)
MRWIVRALALVVVMTAGALVSSLMGNEARLLGPPGVGARLRTYLSTNVAETSDTSPFPELHPRRYPDLAPEALFARAEEAVRSLPRSRIRERHPHAHWLRAVVRTRVLRHRHDLTVWVEADATGGSVLQVRSASRAGRGDLAANARHILDLYERLDQLIQPRTTAAAR